MVYVYRSRVFHFLIMAAVFKNNLKAQGLVRTTLTSLLMAAACAAGSYATADGEPTLSELAAPCLACHSIDPDGLSHVGPSLAGIAGRKLGADRDYTYSDAFVKKASEGLIWDRETLDRFLEEPQALVEGSSMSYPGVIDPAHRALLLDWLMSDPTGKVAELADANYSGNSDVQEVLAIAGDTEYGEYLAGECLTCHQIEDNSGSVPQIHNLTPDYFVNALLEYQKGARSNSVMQSISGALGPEEIAALSTVFSLRASDN